MKNVRLSPGSMLSVCMLFVTSVVLQAQMVSVINSDKDDEFAHAYDFQVTPDFDESTDGFCEDSLRRCTLRAALEEASILEMPAYVTFNLPSPGIIHLDDSQGSFGPPDGSRLYGDNQNVEIAGSGAGTINILAINNDTHVKGIRFADAIIGILIAGNGNRLGLDNLNDANYIGGMIQNGILIAGNNNNITGNVIGLDVIDQPDPNLFGIFITGNENVIGGTEQAHRNIISSNDIGIGVYTIGGDTSGLGNYILRNQIGTDVAGENARGNRVGIEIIGPNVLVGFNTISGNTQSGILTGLDAYDILINQNIIGLDVVAQDPIPNQVGVTLGPGSISCKVDTNLIMGNIESGITVAGNDAPELLSTLHYIRGNTIANNTGPGIIISGNVTHTTIGSSQTADFPSNSIYNNSYGVAFATLPNLGIPRHNVIRKNIFHDNAGKSIRIYPLCPTCQEQTFPPVIETYEEVDPVTAVITGTHHTAGSKIDIYIGDLNLAGQYEGGIWLGSATVDANFNFILTVDNCQCDIVATATSPLGSTSEFTDGKQITTALEDQPALAYSLKTYPNPFDQEVNIRFTLPGSDHVTLDIYDVMGKKIKTLLNEHLLAGEYQFSWIPESISEGMYYYRLVLESNSETSGKIIFDR